MKRFRNTSGKPVKRDKKKNPFLLSYLELVSNSLIESSAAIIDKKKFMKINNPDNTIASIL